MVALGTDRPEAAPDAAGSVEPAVGAQRKEGDVTNDWRKRVARLEADLDRLLQRALDQDTRIEGLVDVCRSVVDGGHTTRMDVALAARVHAAAACADCGVWPCVCGAGVCDGCEADR